MRCDDCGKRLVGYSEEWTMREAGLRVTLLVCKRCGRRLRQVKAEDRAKYHAELVLLARQVEGHIP